MIFSDLSKIELQDWEEAKIDYYNVKHLLLLNESKKEETKVEETKEEETKEEETKEENKKKNVSIYY